MDLKTKLSDESIFYNKRHGATTIKNLNKKGIYTIEDFINSDVGQMTMAPYLMRVYRAVQKILRYKYLDETLVTDIILEKEYTENTLDLDNQLLQDLIKLGLSSRYALQRVEKYIDDHGSCKMIDILLFDDYIFFDTFNLRGFYIDYYNTHMNKENIKKSTVEGDKLSFDILNPKNELEKLKNELVSLLNQKNQLDMKISLLLEKINTLEGGKSNNARK